MVSTANTVVQGRRLCQYSAQQTALRKKLSDHADSASLVTGTVYQVLAAFTWLLYSSAILSLKSRRIQAVA
mgnify:CR=1 FL=1|jgi:hypothetical protein